MQLESDGRWDDFRELSEVHLQVRVGPPIGEKGGGLTGAMSWLQTERADRIRGRLMRIFCSELRLSICGRILR